MKKANITLYTIIGNPDRIETAVRDRFKGYYLKTNYEHV